MKQKKVLFLVNNNKDKNLILTNGIVSFLIFNNFIVYLESQILNNSQFNNKALLYDNNISVDFALVLGGDGTLLNKLHEYKDRDFPYFGINMGRVGCLTEASLDNYKQKLIQILNDDFIIENRSTIDYEISVDDKCYKGIAFNEVCVDRGKLFKMLLLNIFINEKNKTSFYADGVIVATSTGSSAYSLSSGGPLLLPTAKNYVITPLCPQLRTITSLVVNDTDVISIDIKDITNRQSYDEHKPMVVIDGKLMIEINSESKITIRKSNKIFRLIKVENEKSLFEPTFKVAMSNKNLFND